MGYPMSYPRVVNRNGLQGDYSYSAEDRPEINLRHLIAGDLRRFEKDLRDPMHLAMWAATVGISQQKAKRFLDLLFDGNLIQEFQATMPDNAKGWGAFWRKYWPDS
jgi:hypothetical protein